MPLLLTLFSPRFPAHLAPVPSRSALVRSPPTPSHSQPLLTHAVSLCSLPIVLSLPSLCQPGSILPQPICLCLLPNYWYFSSLIKSLGSRFSLFFFPSAFDFLQPDCETPSATHFFFSFLFNSPLYFLMLSLTTCKNSPMTSADTPNCFFQKFLYNLI